MSLKRVFRLIMTPWIGLNLIVIAASGIAGCEASHRVHAVPDEAQPLSADVEKQAWEEGKQAFEDGSYQKALAIFEFLSDSARNEHLCRKLLYAQACTRLAVAQTAHEFNEAMALWNCWSQQASGNSDSEDPRMLAPILDRLNAQGATEQSLPKVAKPKPRPKSSYADQLANKDLAMYKNLLQAKEKELEKMKARLDTREKEVRRLKHQIDSIEAIHLKYQEKKKEVSTP